MNADKNSNISTFRLFPRSKLDQCTLWTWLITLKIHEDRWHLWWLLLTITIHLLFFIWFPVVSQSSKIPPGFTSTGISYIAILVIVFFVFSLNLHNSNAEKTNHDEQEFRGNISKISFSLLQTNLKVASNYIDVIALDNDNKPLVTVSTINYSEAYLRRLDRELMIKESLASIDNVIQARQLAVSGQVADVKKEMQKVSRAMTAAVSGGAGGFIAYELGNSVKNYWLLSTHKHPIDMNYWLTGTVQHVADPKKSEVLNAYMNSQFRQPELLSEAILLTITLFVSFGAAIIGWRKSTISSDI